MENAFYFCEINLLCSYPNGSCMGMLIFSYVKNLGNMKQLIYNFTAFFCLVMLAIGVSSCGTVNESRALTAGVTALQAFTVSDDMVKGYVKEFIHKSDSSNTVCGPNDAYTKRMERIAGGFNNKDGINIKVYRTNDVNAFACADGSVRVYTGLMDIMTDDEVLGVIGHEIGHVMKKHTKNAYKKAILNAALREGIASTGDVAAAVSDSVIGQLGEAVMNSQFSQKQEFEADDYGYAFLKNHGKNPLAMAKSFKKLKELEAKAGSKRSTGLQQLLSTHPQLDVRIERMEKRAVADGFKE